MKGVVVYINNICFTNWPKNFSSFLGIKRKDLLELFLDDGWVKDGNLQKVAKTIAKEDVVYSLSCCEHKNVQYHNRENHLIDSKDENIKQCENCKELEKVLIQRKKRFEKFLEQFKIYHQEKKNEYLSKDFLLSKKKEVIILLNILE